MPSATVEELNAATSETLQSEISKAFASESRGIAKPGPAMVQNVTKHAFAAEPETLPGQAGRLPRRIVGGFRGLGEDLDRRARDWKNMVRLLEQQRPQLETVENEQDRLYEAFVRIVPEVQDSGRALKTLLTTTKSGDVTGDISSQFNASMKALEELEAVSAALASNLLLVRANWEQYARTVIKAQKMRDDLRGENGER